MFDNTAPRRIFGPRMKESTGRRRKLYNEEIDNWYSSASIRLIKSRRVS